MRIDLLCDNLFTRTQLKETWARAGADVRRLGEDVGELVIVDLTAGGAVERIGELRARLPDVEILAFGPHVNGDAFKAARAAGASKLVARGKVLQKILARL
jgi:hypothetical protein